MFGAIKKMFGKPAQPTTNERLQALWSDPAWQAEEARLKSLRERTADPLDMEAALGMESQPSVGDDVQATVDRVLALMGKEQTESFKEALYRQCCTPMSQWNMWQQMRAHDIGGDGVAEIEMLQTLPIHERTLERRAAIAWRLRKDYQRAEDTRKAKWEQDDRDYARAEADRQARCAADVQAATVSSAVSAALAEQRKQLEKDFRGAGFVAGVAISMLNRK